MVKKKNAQCVNNMSKTREQLFNEIVAIHNEQVKQGYEWSYGRWRGPNEPDYIEIDSIPSFVEFFKED